MQNIIGGSVICRNRFIKLILLFMGGVFCLSCSRSQSDDYMLDYDYIRRSLSSDPGYGLETDGRGPIHQPMAYGLVAWACANRGDKAGARQSADWLVDNLHEDAPGWGLGWEWDAFQDGTTNSAETVYGITTAISIEGLLRTYLLTKDERYLDAVISVMDYYSQFQCPTNGFFYYSDQPHDFGYEVPNITAMLMAQYCTLGAILNSSRYKSIADFAYDAMVRTAIKNDNYVYWRYIVGVKNERNNDLVHAGYIAYGIYIYEAYRDKHQFMADRAIAYLEGFVDDDIYLFHQKGVAEKNSKRSNSWGVGMLLYIQSIVKDKDNFMRTLSFLNAWLYDDYHFSRYPDDGHHSPRDVAHLLLGLSLCRNGNFIDPAFVSLPVNP